MTIDLTVKLLAMELKISIDRLLSQFADIGINKISSDYVSQEEKNVLFTYINYNQQRMGVLSKLTLQRKVRSTLNVFGSGGKSKKVQVEVRKKRTYIQCNSNISHDIKQENIEKTDTNAIVDKKVDVLNDTDFSKNSCLQSKISRNSVSMVVNDMQDKYNQSNITLIKTKLSDNDVIKNFKSNQYKKVKNIVHDAAEKPIYTNITSQVSYDDVDTSITHTVGNKKKINTDRRVRVRQRIRLSRSRSNKANINLKNRKHKDSFFEMKYDEYDDHRLYVRGVKNRQRKPSVLTHAFKKPVNVVSRDVVIGEMITVSELANKMAVKSSQVIQVMIRLGTLATINQVIDQQMAQLVAEEMGHNVVLRHENDLESMVMNDRDVNVGSNVLLNHLEHRAPIVTIMGHVDHGKTSLLDYIRSSRLVDLEAGGITQRMGAYCVEIPNKGMITFIDTPGHAAFTNMRMRGVRITDIVVLVVAIDDGVMPQTVEAIEHVKCANIPMIVALNKIDKSIDVANVDRIRNELAQQGVVSEEWGGETQFVSISAKLGTGIDILLDAILLESEVLELKSVRSGMATGIVIESFLDKGRGPVAVILIREGTLRCGDIVLCGLEFGRVRAMHNEFGSNVDSAGPSVPVEVFGLSGIPFAGDVMSVVRNERKAREVALYRQGKFRAVKLEEKKKDKFKQALVDISSLENGSVVNFNVVLKADIQGSVEAIVDVLSRLSNSDVKINIVGSGVGGITETDVSLAIATRSILLGFNVRSDILARRIIELENVDVYCYSVIYDLIRDIKKLITGMLMPRHCKKNVAVAEVRNVFGSSKLGNIAGCMILEGVVRRRNKVRVLRKKIVVHEGEVESLRRFKDDVNEVRAGMECGIVIKNYNDIHSGDYIEIFEENVDNIGTICV
ncbi:translation initiation factor IF-2 [Blochmannia endosymbiont of Polyrhachis (Hedomyrma) turneri]|uniref:translation initiation factor IF-2 n=1 Tax=Blochmannia endosymbiont of Polyrhachis (Hedomyrma) turneri TaxID=1505596 RepID=UPI00061A60F4|nr:translation initiation factor IF-2 [Blochmannia endosymbiont of Polyrhachis (Hedomyrma) turneri]AKC59689.1 translation initiation factor IF-2 [Blochmannia endosymbiont of Polyrhachis (Hedomyrma) turneri]